VAVGREEGHRVTGPPQRPGDHLEELEPRVGRFGFGRDPWPWRVIGEHRSEGAIRGVVSLGLLLEAPEDLHPRPVRRRALGLLAAPPAHRDAECAGTDPELTRDAGLSDARFAYDEHESPLAADGTIERPHQTTELSLAADKEVARVGRHRQAGDDSRAFGAFGGELVHSDPPRAGALSHDT